MDRAWTLEIDGDNIAWLTFDLPGEKVNKFTRRTLEELDALLDAEIGGQRIDCLVIKSGKRDSFIVGADIGELAAIAGPDDARAKADAGKAVFAKIAALPAPTIALVDGACLGGGLELALACTYRIVTDHPKTSLGVPEVNLGILPGWGGTLRLPRLIGLAPALKMILGGKPLDARRAHRAGLADAIAARPFVEAETRRFAESILTRQGARAVARRRKRRRRLLDRLLAATPVGRRLVYRGARRQVMQRTKGHYPAPLEALGVVKATYGRGLDASRWALESEAFARLACTPISRHLVWLFQASQRLKKGGDAEAPVSTAGVVGAGIMGGGIAGALSRKGIPVRLKDVSWEALVRGTAAAASDCAALVKRRRIAPHEVSLAMHRISPATDYTGFGGADVVIEAVAEDLDIKKKVLAAIEKVVRPDAVIATNTSSLPLGELAAALERPERFLGLHFFNPVGRMPLVEVIPWEGTSPQAVVAATALVRQIGKTPLVVGDCAGFLVNRILLPYLVESAWMLEEGVDPARIDRALERFGMPMGPLALVDEVGLDVGHKVAKVLEGAYGERMHVPQGLGSVAAGGRYLGRKTGAGFYKYRNGRKRLNRKVVRLARAARGRDGVTPRQLTDDEIVDRAVLIMVNEAARCLDEGVVETPEALDMAMVLGTGFAPFRGGLLHYADERGVAEIRGRLAEMAETYGDRFAAAPLIDRIASNGGHFYEPAEAR